jgi:formamidopyrimidine-DNA glycosylase
MPELPEVETTRRGIAPHIEGKIIQHVIVRERRMRWPIPHNLPRVLAGQRIERVARRGKYLLLYTRNGCLILHLGMSGSLRVLDCNVPAQKHDHVDIQFHNGVCLRLRDPRRFGCLLWTRGDPLRHELLRHLGPEPLEDAFSGGYLFDKSRGRKLAVKLFIMNSRIVTGVGNIYANEALFAAGIHPLRAAGRISLLRYERLAGAIKEVLQSAIRAGGTTLRDFTASDGRPGYFRLKLNVYEQGGKPCVNCGTAIKCIQQGQRATYYCPNCQR